MTLDDARAELLRVTLTRALEGKSSRIDSIDPVSDNDPTIATVYIHFAGGDTHVISVDGPWPFDARAVASRIVTWE
jgi:hypothetical protein